MPARGKGWRWTAFLAVLPWSGTGCELAEVTIAVPEELVVAEVHLHVLEGSPGGLAVLHRTTGYASRPVDGATVLLRGEDGEVHFRAGEPEECFEPEPVGGWRASCLVLDPIEATGIVYPGASLDVEVLLPDGGRLEGATRVPGDFDLVSPRLHGGACELPEARTLTAEWTPAAGSWAYLPEARIEGLREALEPRGIEVRTDPITLQGLAISEADTTVVFPTGFGVFDRFGDDSALLLAIRDGLPAGTSVRLVVAALERNAVNWVRGGNFNPSGQIRIPSLFGDGTGVVGAKVAREARITVGEGGPDTCHDM